MRMSVRILGHPKEGRGGGQGGEKESIKEGSHSRWTQDPRPTVRTTARAPWESPGLDLVPCPTREFTAGLQKSSSLPPLPTVSRQCSGTAKKPLTAFTDRA